MKTIRSIVTSLLAVAIVLAATSPVFAAQPVTNLSWDAPTSFTDGTALKATVDLSTYTVECGGIVLDVAVTNDTGEVVPLSDIGLPDGTHVCTVTATDTANAVSDPSNPTPEVVAINGEFFLRSTGTPSAPTGPMFN